MLDSKSSNDEALSFCTAVSCIDGRVQLPVIQYLTRRVHVEFVDVVSDTGPASVLAHDPDSETAGSIDRRIDVSRDARQSQGLAIAAHHDCWGHQRPLEGQIDDLRRSAAHLRLRYPSFQSWLCGWGATGRSNMFMTGGGHLGISLVALARDWRSDRVLRVAPSSTLNGEVCHRGDPIRSPRGGSVPCAQRFQYPTTTEVPILRQAGHGECACLPALPRPASSRLVVVGRHVDSLYVFSNIYLYFQRRPASGTKEWKTEGWGVRDYAVRASRCPQTETLKGRAMSMLFNRKALIPVWLAVVFGLFAMFGPPMTSTALGGLLFVGVVPPVIMLALFKGTVPLSRRDDA